MPVLRVLMADDEPVSRTVVGAMLKKAGYEVCFASDGEQAWAKLDGAEPAVDCVCSTGKCRAWPGPEVVERIRAPKRAGAHVRHPADLPRFIRRHRGRPARLAPTTTSPSRRTRTSWWPASTSAPASCELQTALAERVRSLEEALANVKALQTLLPMCAYCKSIRNDQNYWEKVETYFHEHSGVSFSHSYCPTCYERFVQAPARRARGRRARRSDEQKEALMQRPSARP